MNKRAVISILFFVGAAILAVVFSLLLCQDYLVLYPHGSAPFYIYVIIRTAELLIPAAICLGTGMVLKKRTK